MAARIHKGNVGTSIEFALVDQDLGAVDLTGYSTLQIIAVGPTGTRKVWSATPLGSSLAGVIRFVTTLATDLDLAGEWRFQPHIIIPAGEFWGDVHKVTVEANL